MEINKFPYEKKLSWGILHDFFLRFWKTETREVYYPYSNLHHQVWYKSVRQYRGRASHRLFTVRERIWRGGE